MTRFYRELPEGYALVREADAIQNKKIAIGMNIAALVLMLVALAAGFWRDNRGNAGSAAHLAVSAGLSGKHAAVYGAA